VSAFYESSPALFRHLIEHYGMPDQICPLPSGAMRLCGPMASTVDEVMRHVDLPRRARALDLGCAVGGSTFRLRRYFSHVVGVDGSRSFLNAARTLQRSREVSAVWEDEKHAPRSCFVRLPADAIVDGVEFREAAVDDLPAGLGTFDLVFMEKVLECLPDPERCVRQMADVVVPGGYFVHVSFYWWEPELTAPDKQLGTPAQALSRLETVLAPHFTREHRFKVPFLIEGDATWFSYGVAEALVWKRR